MPTFLMPLLSLLWHYKIDLAAAAATILAIVFASSFDRYLIVGALVAAYILGHGAGAK